MGHDGMLYSLPSRELIADSVDYMVQAHKADALICISNCDKITPGMLLAALRLNLPTIFVSGGPMEAGKTKLSTGPAKLDLIDPMIAAGDDSISDAEVTRMEVSACPTCGSCSGMFTANSMNCLNEAIGLALPGNGTVLATHHLRWQLFEQAARRTVAMAKAYYMEGDSSVLPRSIAMGGSTNTVLHLLAMAQEAGVDFTMKDIDRLSRQTPLHLQGGAGLRPVPRGRRRSRRRHSHDPRGAGRRRQDPHRHLDGDGRNDGRDDHQEQYPRRRRRANRVQDIRHLP